MDRQDVSGKGDKNFQEMLDKLEPSEKRALINSTKARFRELVEDRKTRIKPKRAGITKQKIKDITKFCEDEWPRIEVNHTSICDLISVKQGEVSVAVPISLGGMCFKFYLGYSMLQHFIHNKILALYDYCLTNGKLPDQEELEAFLYLLDRTASGMYNAWTFAQPDYRVPKGKFTNLGEFLEGYVKIENRLCGGKDGTVPLGETMDALAELADATLPENWPEREDEEQSFGDVDPVLAAFQKAQRVDEELKKAARRDATLDKRARESVKRIRKGTGK